METVAGVFAVRSDAERATARLRSGGLSKDKMVLLVPGEPGERPNPPVPTVEGEQPGMGKAVGGVVGGAMGIAGGFEAGAIASAAIPGIGPVMAVGLLGAAVLGLAGAGAGAAVGKKLEENLAQGLPTDELFVYEDALRKGRSVVIAFPEDEKMAKTAREIMDAEGAETIDSARKQWWIGLESAEREYYAAAGGNFEKDQYFYRTGFEAALHAGRRGREYDQVISDLSAQLEELKQRYPDADVEGPFRRGYERGQAHYQMLISKRKAA
ncbi:MAG: hypothetical protein HY648_08825 [Acidobacteria bacterium]|nr:hypothetical protein [Acidobacteriota bacterium]